MADNFYYAGFPAVPVFQFRNGIVKFAHPFDRSIERMILTALSLSKNSGNYSSIQETSPFSLTGYEMTLSIYKGDSR